jgi:hypothetical protein
MLNFFAKHPSVYPLSLGYLSIIYLFRSLIIIIIMIEIDPSTLPTELLHQIFELFCQHCAEKHLATPRHDLWGQNQDQDQGRDQYLNQKIKYGRRCLINLSLTCTKWGYAAQQALHHHFGFLETTYEQQISFCRTIFGNPKLGRQLRVAKFRRIGTFLNAKWAKDWIAEPLARYSEFISYPGSIFDMDSLTWEDYIVPLILLEAPNLEHAVLHGLDDWLVFKDFNVRNVTQARALPQNLKSLSLGRQHRMIWLNPERSVMIQDTFISVFLATFEKLQMLTISKPHLYLLFKPPPLQNLRSLRLFNVATLEHKLRLLIDGAPSLEEFVFWEMERAELAPHPYVTPDEVFKILSSRRMTLRKVVLQMMATPVLFTNTDQLTTPKTLRDLAQLTKLEELRMNPEMFCNIPELLTRKQALSDETFISIFPSSLQTLCIDTTIIGFNGFGAALGAYARSTYKRPQEQKFKQLTLHITSVFPRDQLGWLNLREPSEECLKAMRGVVSGKWEENGHLDITLDQLQWYSCTERGKNSILPKFNG